MDTKERIKEIQDILVSYKDMESMILLREMITLRREQHRNRLEGEKSSEVRGRAKECKDLLQLFD